MVSSIIYCSRSVHFRGVFTASDDPAIPPRWSKCIKQKLRIVSVFLMTSTLWTASMVRNLRFLDHPYRPSWCFGDLTITCKGYLWSSEAGKTPRKSTDLEQYIILDTKKFSQLQKLEKFGPGEIFRFLSLFFYKNMLALNTRFARSDLSV